MTLKKLSSLAALAVALAAAGYADALAQSAGPPLGTMPDLEHGALVFHGNYCGPGNRGPGKPPIDALDRACMHHDHCSPDFDSGRRPACSCNHRLHDEAARVASDPREPDDLRALAGAVSTGATLLPCRPDR